MPISTSQVVDAARLVSTQGIAYLDRLITRPRFRTTVEMPATAIAPMGHVVLIPAGTEGVEESVCLYAKFGYRRRVHAILLDGRFVVIDPAHYNTGVEIEPLPEPCEQHERAEQHDDPMGISGITEPCPVCQRWIDYPFYILPTAVDYRVNRHRIGGRWVRLGLPVRDPDFSLPVEKRRGAS